MKMVFVNGLLLYIIFKVMKSLPLLVPLLSPPLQCLSILLVNRCQYLWQLTLHHTN